MLRRKGKLEESGTLLRAFQDTRKTKRRSRTEDSTERDGALEELVFGRQPFSGLGDKASASDYEAV